MRVWTEEQKQQQRDAIRLWAPWKKSTGPRTAQGKSRSSLNSTKHGFRSRAGIELMSFFTRQRAFLRAVELRIRKERLQRKLQKIKNSPNELLKTDAKNSTMVRRISTDGAGDVPRRPPDCFF